MSNPQEQLDDDSKVPTHEEVVEFYKTQNEILELRKENARLQAEISLHEADRYEAIAKLAHYQGMLAKAATTPDEEEEPEVKRTLRKDK